MWYELRLHTTEPLKEPIVNRLFELGAGGISENDVASGGATVSGFFEAGQEKTAIQEMNVFLASVAKLFPAEPAPKLEVVEVPDDNWGERYKEFYTAQKLSELFFLRPAWDTTTPIPSGMIPIFMEPGQAFGTGLHASTRLALRLVQGSIELHPKVAEIKAIDVGTGTGVLAIGAWKLGVRDIDAIDNDPLAVEAAKENIVLNECPGIRVSETPLSQFKGPYQIIISNILFETHRELTPDYRRLLEPGGQLILSGLLASQKRELVEWFEKAGFTEEASDTYQEWMAITFTRHEGSPVRSKAK